MSKDTIQIEIDGKPFSACKGQMLIEVTDANGIYIPRFCYHRKLSVAANCRMCLVDVERAPKPLPACATPVTEGMVVRTRSPLAIEAQRGVMEFLLINHPLDCPICDQGGECELQDLAMGYGSDVSRYQEKKRVVQDKNIGALIQTDMTRCIHCTRCVRFGEEIAGLRELGATGRGEQMEIGTYIAKTVSSELAGNVIDLCPVGALTSKPFRYSARTWELVQKSGIAMHDGVGSNVYFHCKGQRVMRVVPAENEKINEIWLSDRDRYSYQGLYSDDRLHYPEIKRNGSWQRVAWEVALQCVQERLQAVLLAAGGEQLGVLASSSLTLQEYWLLQKLTRGMGCSNIDHRYRQRDFSGDDSGDTASLLPWLGCSLEAVNHLQAALLIGSNVRKQQPIINHRLRQAVIQRGCQVMVLNMLRHDFNYPLLAHWAVAPAALLQHLLTLLQVAGEDEPKLLAERMPVDDSHRRVVAALSAQEDSVIWLGNDAVAHPHYATILNLARRLAYRTGSRLGQLTEFANTLGAYYMGVLPHRLPATQAVEKRGLNAWQMLAEPRRAYLLMGLEPEQDCYDGGQALQALQEAECVVSVTAFATATMREYADVLLPLACSAENEGSMVNNEAMVQHFSAAVRPPGEAKAGWKILRVLAERMPGIDFDWVDLAGLNKEIEPLLTGLAEISPLTDTQLPALPEWQPIPQPDGLQRITTVPMNAIDPLVRRAQALQKNQVEVAAAQAYVNEATARLHDWQQGDLIGSLHDDEVVVTICVDSTLPDNCVLIHAGQAVHAAFAGMGEPFEWRAMELEQVS